MVYISCKTDVYTKRQETNYIKNSTKFIYCKNRWAQSAPMELLNLSLKIQ